MAGQICMNTDLNAVLRSICECTAESAPSGVRPAIRTSLSSPTCRNTTWFTREKSLMNARYGYTGFTFWKAFVLLFTYQ